jgi:hypothetical protein
MMGPSRAGTRWGTSKNCENPVPNWAAERADLFRELTAAYGGTRFIRPREEFF